MILGFKTKLAGKRDATLPDQGGTRRSFLRRHSTTLQAVLIVLALCGYPHVVMRLNPVPTPERLEVLAGVLVNAKSRRPHVRLRAANGDVMHLEFPGNLQGMYFGMQKRSPLPEVTRLQQIAGCRAEVAVDRVRFAFIPMNPRIWSLRCGDVSLSFDRLAAYYREESGLTAGQAFVWFAAALMVIAALINDFRKRGK